MSLTLIVISGLVVLPAQSTAILPGEAAIVGRIIDRDSKRPLVGVFVRLSSADLRRQLVAQTDADGRYAFEDLADGDYRVTATHDGYIDQAYGVPDARMGLVSPEALISVAARSRAQIDLALVRIGIVTGRVLSQDGRPLNNAAVSLTMVTDRGIRVSGRWIGRTNERGDYVIANVPEGTYQVSAMWIDQAESGTNLRPKQIFHPSTDSPEQATTIALVAGRTVKNIDIVIPASELLRIQGKVIRSSRAGTVEGYLLGVSSARDVAINKDDGTFTTPRLSAGRYTFVARTRDAEISEATWLTVDLSVELTDLVLGLLPTGVISGRVVSDDGSPVPQTLQVAAVLADQGKEMDSLMRDRVDLAEGATFELRDLFGERVLRIVGRTEGWAIDKVIQGKTPVTSLTIAPGGQIDDVRIIVTRRPR